MIKLTKYQLQIYFKGSSFIMPLLVTFVFLYMMYSVKPVDIVSSYLVSGIVLFFVMVWIGLTITFKENIVMEQVLLLRVQNIKDYYISKIFVLVFISIGLDIIYTFFPVIDNIINDGSLFTRQLTVSDVVNAFLIQLGCALIGGVIGNLFHPRVMKDKKMGIVMAVFFSLLVIIKTELITTIPISQFILWIIPPVMSFMEVYGKADVFEISKTIVFFLVLVFYAAVYGMIKSIICHKNKF